MRHLVSASLALLSTLAMAADPWGGDIDYRAAGEQHQKACAGCHIRMYGGDGSKMYTRDGRMLSNKQELLQRVAACNSTMNAGWFPEEEGQVAAWLNRHYYRFEN